MHQSGSPTTISPLAQTEESYISAAELGRLSGMRAEIVLGTELTLLQGLKFDLIVFSPFNAIEGFMQVMVGEPEESVSGFCVPRRLQGSNSSAWSAEDGRIRRQYTSMAPQTLSNPPFPFLHSPSSWPSGHSRKGTDSRCCGACPSWLARKHGRQGTTCCPRSCRRADADGCPTPLHARPAGPGGSAVRLSQGCL